MMQPQDSRATISALPNYRPVPMHQSPWGDVRIGDVERDATCDQLAAHFGAGRLSRDELDFRMGSALSAQSRAQLVALTADLPSTSQPFFMSNPTKTSARAAAEVAMTLLAIAAAICLFLMMTMLGASHSAEGFITSSLAILASSVITGTSVYWLMQRKPAQR